MEVALAIVSGLGMIFFGLWKASQKKVKGLEVDNLIQASKEGDAVLKEKQDELDKQIDALNKLKDNIENMTPEEIEKFWNKKK